MSPELQQALKALDTAENRELLREIKRGIEKESLRITPEGRLSEAPHPAALGSALTHPSITTDYSEALMEFITPVDASIEHSLETLSDIHRYTYSKLGDELLWNASMPCVVGNDASIPVARYGSSNVATMKTVYRYGLGHRYGRAMQTIAGIHYNFSMPQAFWDSEWQAAGKPGTLQDWITRRYLSLIRNFHRYSWLLIYLFGASPAVCSSFLRGRGEHNLEAFDDKGYTLYLPHATALRMGDLGYKSAAQRDLRVSYNALDDYVETLREAIMQPHAEYAKFPSGQHGEYEQLSDSLLQIENEFYSTIRPKRVAYSGETPLNALRRGGIEYIEVRCIDVSPFLPVGIDAEQIRFLDAFLVSCLLGQSPACSGDEQTRIDDNLRSVVNRGREPGLSLSTPEGDKTLKAWATELLGITSAVAERLDAAHGGGSAYRDAVAAQQAKVDDPELTPSARLLRELREHQQPFFLRALDYAKQWQAYFLSEPVCPERQAQFDAESVASLETQREIEAADEISFAAYLDQFYSQYRTL